MNQMAIFIAAVVLAVIAVVALNRIRRKKRQRYRIVKPAAARSTTASPPHYRRPGEKS